MTAQNPRIGDAPEQIAASTLEQIIHSNSVETLKAAASDPSLTEDLALALVKRPDLPPEVLEQISKNSTILKSRKVKLAVLAHSKTPRYIAIALVRQLFTFDLMRVTLIPTVPSDTKMAAEELLIRRFETISSGEKCSLARRASGRIAGVLLSETELRVVQAALENPRLTEAQVVRAVARKESSATFVDTLCRHAKWSVRRDVRIALLCNEHTAPGYASEFAKGIPAPQLEEILQGSHLAESVRSVLLKTQ